MIYWVFAFMVLMAIGCVPASADKDTPVKDKSVLVKGDDFAAIMEKAKKNQANAVSVGKKADGAVTNKVEQVSKKITALESTVEKLEEQNEKLQEQIKANPDLDMPYVIEPIIDSTDLSKEKSN
jgi:peptidoglycan hydrolase CwlO-like protein